ncbi:MAG: hypothetical protein JO001_29460 [Alphaproteobacteria bacterium]|nr:hypothetical protein [Alphaproteobacteria bacterium]
MPVNAYRYCEAIASASAFGWYLYPPLSFSLIWDGAEIAWTYEGAEGWYPLRGAQYPGFLQTFKNLAPDTVADLSPPFLTQGMLPGVVQIWSGYLARTAPGWALLSRGTANIPRTQGYENYEGILESDSWLGPLFTNIRLTRTNSPVEFHRRRPLVQIQPLSRESYQSPSFDVLEAADMGCAEWQRFEATVRPNTDQYRKLGHYAVDTRKRLRAEASIDT